MQFIKKYRKILIILGIILVLFLIFKPKNQQQDINPYTVTKGNVEQIIDLSGNITPASEVNMIFEKTGKVKNIAVKVGEKVYPGKFLASVDNSSLNIQLSQAKNSVVIEETKLDQLKNGLTDEEKLIQENNLKSSENSFKQAENNFYDTLDTIGVQADSIVRSKVDQFFVNGDSQNPTLSLVANSYNVGCCTEQEKLSLNQQRRDIQTNLSLLNEYIYKIKQEGITEYNLELVEQELKTIKTFVDNVTFAINNTYSTDSSLISTINSWKTTMSTARTSMTSLISSLITAENSYYTARHNYDLAQSNYLNSLKGATKEEIKIQEMSVANAKNNVQSIENDIYKTQLYSPITGIVSKINLTKEEQAPSDTAIVISSDSVYEVSVLVSEIDAVKLSINNPVRITIDAYSTEKSFNGKVIEIDKAETIEDGVISYNTKIQFTTEENLLSGLTADVEIIANQKEGVLQAPLKYISYKNNKAFVKVIQNNKITEKEVVLGIEGENNVEIIEGLNENDKIVLPEVTLKHLSTQEVRRNLK